MLCALERESSLKREREKNRESSDNEMWQQLRAVRLQTKRRVGVRSESLSLIKPIPFQMTVGTSMINAVFLGLWSSGTATKAKVEVTRIVVNLLNTSTIQGGE